MTRASTTPSSAVVASLARARLVALDVDGTLTDGRVVYGDTDELVCFHVRDGQGIRLLAEAGVEVAWITGRGCAATQRRAEELGVRELFVRVASKTRVLAEVQERLGITPDETVAMGDDLPDLQLLGKAAFLAAPSDAHPLVRERAAFVTRARGGCGAVRELVDALLAAQGRSVLPADGSTGGAPVAR